MSNRRRLLDLLGYALTVVVGFPALFYPFGRDQALYDYVGRGWLAGMLPYVETFDHKPPALYLLYALGASLPVPAEMGVRVLELATLLGLGWLLARLVELEEGSLSGGAVALGLAVFHYGSFDWWHSAQSEVWEALFLMAAAVVARRARAWQGAALAGALAGVGVGFKPTALLIATVVAWMTWRTTTEGRWRRLLAFAAGGTSVGLLLLLPWALEGQLGTLWEVLIRYNMAHATSETEADLSYFFSKHLATWLPTALAALVGILASRGKSDLKRRGWELALLWLASVLTVVVQSKFYAYHWSVVGPFQIALAAWGLLALGSRWRLPRGLGLGLAVAFALLVLPLTTYMYASPQRSWAGNARAAIDYARGAIDREALVAPFRSRHEVPYVVKDVERLSRTLNQRAKPDDTLCVRSYEPGFYTHSGLWCPSRFAVDFPLQDADVRFRARRKWRTEHQRALEASPPTFMVTVRGRAKDQEDLVAKGYRKIQQSGRYILYGR